MWNDGANDRQVSAGRSGAGNRVDLRRRVRQQNCYRSARQPEIAAAVAANTFGLFLHEDVAELPALPGCEGEFWPDRWLYVEVEPSLSRDKAPEPEPEPPARGKRVEMDLSL